jgi:Putative MetA-pathway of phenol degradation
MKSLSAAGSWVFIVATVVCLFLPARLLAQELEPGAYWPLPKSLNIVTVVNGFNWGDVAFDAAAPIDEASAAVNTTALSFTRAFALVGRSAHVGVAVPIVGGHVEGLYLGTPAEVDRFGLGDLRVRLAMNLYGAPAMAPKVFASYLQRTIVGVSVVVVPPLGEYDATKLINLGTNRWSFKPEAGISSTHGRWVLEGMAGVWVFTDNPDFVGGRTREQDAIVALQAHVTYRFKRSMWLAGDANFYTGGRTTISGQQNLDLQKNSRIGATFSTAVGPSQAIRASVSRGAYTTIGADFTSIAVGYNYAWAR